MVEEITVIFLVCIVYWNHTIFLTEFAKKPCKRFQDKWKLKQVANLLKCLLSLDWYSANEGKKSYEEDREGKAKYIKKRNYINP